MISNPTLKLAAFLGLTVLATPGLRAETADEARLRKLEQAVAALQKENASLKQAINQSGGLPAASTETPAPPINKVKLADSVTEVRLYGEGRLRYFMNDGEAAGLDAGDHGDRERLRYRLRLGADVKVQDNWLLGFQIEENNVARSSNVTLGENPFFAKATQSKANFLSSVAENPGTPVTGLDKNGKPVTGTATTLTTKSGSVVTNVNFGDALFLNRVFLRYEPASWMSLEGGKIPNPFVATRMVWDPDLSPEGFGEHFKYTLGADPVPLTDKDGKALPATGGGVKLDLFANFGQFIYDDVGFENSFSSGNGPFTQTPQRTDRWMLGWQLGARATLNQNAYAQVAPAFYHYTGGGNSSAGPFNGDSPLVIVNKQANLQLITFNQTGTNDLAIIDVPVEIGWKWGNVPFTIFGDFSYNVDADRRAEQAGHPDKTAGIAYQVGAGVGAAKKKGDWELKGWWQHSEAFALDQNIVDDDIFDGRLNMEGFYLQGSYQFTNNVSFILQYSHAERIDSTLGTPGFGALGTPAGFPLNKTNLLYVDLNLKF